MRNGKRASQADEAAQLAKRAGSGFLMVELGTGHIFADLALTTKDPEKRQRNTSNALMAYSTLVRFMDRVSFTEAEAADFENGFQLLIEKLSRLGIST